MIWLRKWYNRRQMRKNCFHHDYYKARSRGVKEGESWIREQKIDTGMRKLYWCIKCKKSWIP